MFPALHCGQRERGHGAAGARGRRSAPQHSNGQHARRRTSRGERRSQRRGGAAGLQTAAVRRSLRRRALLPPPPATHLCLVAVILQVKFLFFAQPAVLDRPLYALRPRRATQVPRGVGSHPHDHGSRRARQGDTSANGFLPEDPTAPNGPCKIRQRHRSSDGALAASIYHAKAVVRE